ncbi:MAG: hypothetical protein C0603_04445 [Denitrovibrio sp.]|nr:MAG: hypothetical protein C0603_04445 [Denitrovibrio sp.]
MKTVFSPGCALLIHNPAQTERMLKLLMNVYPEIELYDTCCHHEAKLDAGTQIVNICPGCDRRYRQEHNNVTTIPFWSILDKIDDFEFPDYKGAEMSITDACPTRDQAELHKTIRNILQKMNISLKEPVKTGTNSKCCGDTFYGRLPTEKLKEQMAKRASEMPADDVVVYCVSCSKSMYIGGKTPRFLGDLIFNEKTKIGTFEPEEWHGEIEKFIEAH